MRKFIALLTFLLLATVAVADTGWYQHNGYLHSASFVQAHDGYWYYNGQAYSRSYVPASYSGHCNSCYTAAYYHYTPYYAPAAKLPDYNDDAYLAKFLDLAIQRDKYESKIRAEAFRKQNFLEVAKAMGLEGSLAGSYNGVTPYNHAYGQSVGAYGASGSTAYGYSYSTAANLYGDLDVNQIYQSAYRLNEALIKSASQGNSEFGALVGVAGDNQAKLADVLAKNEAFRAYLASMNQAKVTTQVQQFGQATPPVHMPQVSGLGFQAVAGKCISCHSGTKKAGGFDVASFATMGQVDRMKVIQRLVTTDQNRRMPRMPDGKPGPTVTPEELKVWLSVPLSN